MVILAVFLFILFSFAGQDKLIELFFEEGLFPLLGGRETFRD